MKLDLGVVGAKKEEMLGWPSYKKWDLISQSRLKQEFDKTKVHTWFIVVHQIIMIVLQQVAKAKTKRSVVDTAEYYVTALKTKPDGQTLKVIRREK